MRYQQILPEIFALGCASFRVTVMKAGHEGHLAGVV